MPEYLFVLPGPKTPKGRVGLSETHPDHPKTREFPQGGEAFVANLLPRIVARTPEVNLRLGDKRLKEVDGKDKDALASAIPAYDKDGIKLLAAGTLPIANPDDGKGTGEEPETAENPVQAQVANDPDIKG